MVSKGKDKVTPLAAAVIVPCASRKLVPPINQARAVSLPHSAQSDLESAWLSRIRKLAPVRSAGTLYAGRGFRLAQQAAQTAGARLYIASAGLGLVALDRVVPSYGITVAGHGPDDVSARVTDRFDPVAWWGAVGMGPFATPLVDLFSGKGDGLVIVALTRPYAYMLGPTLAELPEEALTRLRIIGVRLDDFLPRGLRTFALPYDERLDAILPGTRADFPQRALMHFVTEGLPILPHADAARHGEWVRAVLSHQDAPERVKRPRVSDQTIIAVIERHLDSVQGVGRLLRVLRDNEGIACEQARFTRLYRATLAQREAA